MVVYRAKNVRIVSMSQYLWTWLCVYIYIYIYIYIYVVVGGQSSVVRGVREGRGGQGREGVQLGGWSCPSVCWSSPGDSTVSSLMAAGWGSYVTGGWDHLQCRGLCGWDECCRCPGGRGERHQRSSQLLSLSIEGTCGQSHKPISSWWRSCRERFGMACSGTISVSVRHG